VLASAIGGSPYFNINTTYYNGSGVRVPNSVILAADDGQLLAGHRAFGRRSTGGCERGDQQRSAGPGRPQGRLLRLDLRGRE
jgi:hypothetical protein